ncbi:exodeoxyribonuclease VII large subunit [Exiguobacterium mexicanum]|uniref:exodeoxyribonuclease VII large subunit n=1 Tax=Exiguobacterium mexicanum TaxID=340146 RepID=UPI0037BFB88E
MNPGFLSSRPSGTRPISRWLTLSPTCGPRRRQRLRNSQQRRSRRNEKTSSGYRPSLTRTVTNQMSSIRERLGRATNSYGLKSPRFTLTQKRERFEQAEIRLEQGVTKQVTHAKHRLAQSRQQLDVRKLAQTLHRNDETHRQLDGRLKRIRPLERPADRFAAQVGRLNAVSPLAVLARGYTFIEQDGTYVKDVKQLHDGLVTIRFRDGHAVAEVKERHDGETTSRTDV